MGIRQLMNCQRSYSHGTAVTEKPLTSTYYKNWISDERKKILHDINDAFFFVKRMDLDVFGKKQTPFNQ